MVFEMIRKKVFGSDEHFFVDPSYYGVEGYEYAHHNCEEVKWDIKNNLTNFADLMFILGFSEDEHGSLFRQYGDFEIWFLKLDEEHFITEYNFGCDYGHTDIVIFRCNRYEILHCLDDDLIDDYPALATIDLVDIIRKDHIVYYLNYIQERHGKASYVEWLPTDSKTEFLSYMYPDVDAEKLFEFISKEAKFLNNKFFSIEEFVEFLRLSEKYYRHMKEEEKQTS